MQTNTARVAYKGDTEVHRNSLMVFLVKISKGYFTELILKDYVLQAQMNKEEHFWQRIIKIGIP